MGGSAPSIRALVGSSREGIGATTCSASSTVGGTPRTFGPGTTGACASARAFSRSVEFGWISRRAAIRSSPAEAGPG